MWVGVWWCCVIGVGCVGSCWLCLVFFGFVSCFFSCFGYVFFLYFSYVLKSPPPPRPGRVSWLNAEQKKRAGGRPQLAAVIWCYLVLSGASWPYLVLAVTIWCYLVLSGPTNLNNAEKKKRDGRPCAISFFFPRYVMYFSFAFVYFSKTLAPPPPGP